MAKKTLKNQTGAKEKRPAHRPSVWINGLEERILQHITSGLTDKQACDAEGITFSTLWNKRKSDPNFLEASTYAREVRARCWADQIIEIADAPPTYGEHGVDSASETFRKTRIETRFRLLAKLLPKEYGEKVSTEITGANGGPVQMQSMTDEQLNALVQTKLDECKKRGLL